MSVGREPPSPLSSLDPKLPGDQLLWLWAARRVLAGETIHSMSGLPVGVPVEPTRGTLKTDAHPDPFHSSLFLLVQ